MVYDLVLNKEYSQVQKIGVGKTYVENLSFSPDKRYNYKLRLKGEVALPFMDRTEDIYPAYFRKLEDSLINRNGEYTLEFNSVNLSYERSCYNMCRGNFKVGVPYDFSIKYMAQGIKDCTFTLSLEIYYGEDRTRYYYETPDKVYSFNLTDVDDYKILTNQVVFDNQVDFVMVKVSAKGFKGTASLYTPTLSVNGEDSLISPFIPCGLREDKWIGEGFSLTERPMFNVKVNGKEIFNGHKTDRLHRLQGVEFEIPYGVLEKENKIEIEYLPENKVEYSFYNMQLITLAKEFEIVGVAKRQVKGEPFGILCYFENDTDITLDLADGVKYLGVNTAKQGYQVLKFIADKPLNNAKNIITACGKTREFTFSASEKEKDQVITGSGDFIYVNQNRADFYEYVSWYLNNDIGKMITFRSTYRWGMTSEADPEFWKEAINVVNELCLYYVVMIDGRELNGVNANPALELLKGEFFLGEQTHERDGAFTYWDQDVGEHEAFFYHLLSRKLERNGIYGKFSPVYNNEKQARIYYAGDNIKNVKDANQEFIKNLARTRADGATRHTGVTPLFYCFFKAGYDWLGYEGMYGNHEVIFGALRGMSRSFGKKTFGSHLALQWSTVPADLKAHAVRYRLALIESYINGVNHINTEEGLWNIENLYAGFDRFSNATIIHKNEQMRFNRYVQTHTRRGEQKRDIAMMMGNLDGMDCFSTGKVYGQQGKYWAYNSPEYSWDLLKTFYPHADLNSIYYCVYPGGEEQLRKDDPVLCDALVGRYADIVDYKSLGFYSETPYGMIDIIDSEAKNLSDYKAIFMLGWNTCTEEQLKNFITYMENGGIVMLGKAHLYDSIDREEVLTGKAKTINSPLVQKFLSFKDKGNLVYFDKDGYPVDYKEEYQAELIKLAKKYGNKYLSNADRVSFAEYVWQDKTTAMYLVNIDWWKEQPATVKLSVGGYEYGITLSDNYMKTLFVDSTESVGVLIDDCDIEVYKITKDAIALRGYGETVLKVYANGKEQEIPVSVNGEFIVRL